MHLTFQPAAILSLLTRPLTPNQLATVLNLDNITQNGGATPELQNLINILNGLPNEAEIIAALDQLHAESYLSNLPTTLFSNLDFANSMLSCAQYEMGTNSHLKEGSCYWAKLSAKKFDQDRTTNNIAIDEDVQSFTGGIQFAISPSWYLGLAGSYEDTETDIDTRSKVDGYRAQFGAVLKTQIGASTFSAGLTGGFGNFDTKRFINFGGLNLVAEGDQDIQFGSAHARFTHSFDIGKLYLRPIIDASLTYIELEGLKETGGGAANLTLADTDDWYFSFSPSIELGTEIVHSSGAIIRPYLRAGLTYLDNNDISVTTSFSDSPLGVNTFQTSTEFDDLFADLEVGLNIISKNGLNLKFNYEGHFAEDSESHAGGVKLGVKF